MGWNSAAVFSSCISSNVFVKVFVTGFWQPSLHAVLGGGGGGGGALVEGDFHLQESAFMATVSLLAPAGRHDQRIN